MTDPAMDEITIGELARRMSAVEAEMHRGFLATTTQLQAMSVVTRDVYAADRAGHSIEHKDVERRIALLEEGRTWIYRLITGGIITTLISAVITIIVIAPRL